jgi:hypothetical protein
MEKEDYQKLLQIVEDARNECERVRSALAKLHKAKPGSHRLALRRKSGGAAQDRDRAGLGVNFPEWRGARSPESIAVDCLGFR